MSSRAKEWMINGLLLAGIIAILALIARNSLRSEELPERLLAAMEEVPLPAETPVRTPRPFDTIYNPLSGRPDLFPNIGKLDIFRDCITPTPTPPPRTPTPLPTPSLQRVTQTWEYQYSVPRRGIHVFLDTRTKIEHEIPENEWKTFTDPVVKSTINIRAKPQSRIEVLLEGVPAGRTEVQTRVLGY